MEDIKHTSFLKQPVFLVKTQIKFPEQILEKRKNAKIIKFSYVVKVCGLTIHIQQNVRHVLIYWWHNQKSIFIIPYHFFIASPENGTMHEFSCDNSDPLTDFFFDFNDVPRLVSYNVTCTKNG